MSAAVQHPSESNAAWLHGRRSDLLLGAGIAYLISVPLVILVATMTGATTWPFFVAWLIGLAINGPHYGATLLRVYKEREERHKYAFFAVWLTLLLVVLFAISLQVTLLASILVTLYLNWSPWHFAGQNYGISLMFLRRSGIPIEPRAKQLLHASYILSFVLALLTFHNAGSMASFANAGEFQESGQAMLRAGIPHAITAPLMSLCGIAYVACFIGAIALLRRQAPFRQLIPVVSLAMCQSLWFALPAVLEFFGHSSGRSLAFAAIWISAAHSSQYLWVTSHYAKRSDGTTPLKTYLLHTTLVGNGLAVLLGIVASPIMLGQSLWNADVGLLVFSILNLHHFILDGAIWKLRDGRVAQALLKRESETPPPMQSSAAGSRFRRAVVGSICTLCLTVPLCEVGWREAEKLGAYGLSTTLLDGLLWFGRDHEVARVRLAMRLFEKGDLPLARRQLELSLNATPSESAYAGLGTIHEAKGEYELALVKYSLGIAINPSNPRLLRKAGLMQLRMNQPNYAIELLERSLAIEPNHERTRKMLSQARNDLEH